MDIEQSFIIVKNVITDIMKDDIVVTNDTQLIGGKSPLDSMKLVEICLALEDTAEIHNFEFDWTSDATMSKSKSMFRTVESLATEFANQSNKRVNEK